MKVTTELVGKWGVFSHRGYYVAEIKKVTPMMVFANFAYASKHPHEELQAAFADRDLAARLRDRLEEIAAEMDQRLIAARTWRKAEVARLIDIANAGDDT